MHRFRFRFRFIKYFSKGFWFGPGDGIFEGFGSPNRFFSVRFQPPLRNFLAVFGSVNGFYRDKKKKKREHDSRFSVDRAFGTTSLRAENAPPANERAGHTTGRVRAFIPPVST